jgi:hypothetical protein
MGSIMDDVLDGSPFPIARVACSALAQMESIMDDVLDGTPFPIAHVACSASGQMESIMDDVLDGTPFPIAHVVVAPAPPPPHAALLYMLCPSARLSPRHVRYCPYRPGSIQLCEDRRSPRGWPGKWGILYGG